MINAVDLFAGGGGFTHGAEQVDGVKVLWAANHSPIAVEIHARNHPHVQHVCQDLHQADWHAVPSMDLLLASPACQGRSNAATNCGDGHRGSLPKHDADRATAWAVVSCLEVHRPPLCLVENVPQMQGWTLFPSWLDALRRLGYAAGIHVVDAATVGVPQNRVRLLVTLTRSQAPIHLELPKVAPVPFRSCLEQDADGWAPVSSKSDDVQGRVAKARAGRHPTGMFLSQHVTGHPGRSLDRPIGTITTAPSHWNLVRRGRDGKDWMRQLTSVELLRGSTFPDDYELFGTVKADTRLIGNAIPPRLAKVAIEALLRAA
jgi:DNA (cytosine-5)-methyltransferase 1